MKSIILFLVTLILFTGCMKHPDVGSTYSSYLHYVDSSGNDLFTNGNNGYVQDSVKEYEFVNAVKTIVPIPPASAYPYGYFSNLFSSTIVIDGGANYNNDIINHYTKNIIHLKQGVDDTIRIWVSGTKQLGSVYDSLWYNNVLQKRPDTCTIIK